MPRDGKASANRYQAAWRAGWKWMLAWLLAGPLAGYALSRLLPEQFVSSATVEWQGFQSQDAAVQQEAAREAARGIPIIEQRILTPERLASVIEQIGPYPRQADGAQSMDRVNQLRGNLRVVSVARGFTVLYSARDARLAQQVCAGIVALFLKDSNPAGKGEDPAAASALAAQVQDARRKMDQEAARWAEFKRRHAGELDGGNHSMAENSLMVLNAQLTNSKAAFDRAVQDKSLTEALLREQLAAWRRTQATGTASTLALEQELAAKQAQLAALETRYTHDYPDVVKLRNDITQLERKLDEARKSAKPTASQNPDIASPAEPAEIAQTRAQIRQLERSIQERSGEQQRLEQQIQAAKSQQASAAALAKESESLSTSYIAAQATYQSLLEKQKQSDAAAVAVQSQNMAAFQLTEPPSLPEKPSFPDPIVFTLGGIAGGILLGGLTLCAGAWSDTTLRDEADVDRYLKLPTLAIIPTTGAQVGSVLDGVRGSGRKGGSGAREESVLADV